jgi:hypothetical protein
MKKFLLAALVFVGSLGVANAQEIASKGTSMVNLGIGLGYRFGGSMSVPPLSVAYDYSLKSGLIDGNGAITLGGYLAYTSANYSYWAQSTTASYTVLGVRGMFHYQFVPKLDTYAGLMLGYHFTSVSSTAPAEHYESSIAASAFDMGVILGARYFFTPRIGAFTELGYSLPYWNLGVTFKL